MPGALLGPRGIIGFHEALNGNLDLPCGFQCTAVCVRLVLLVELSMMEMNN